MKSNLPSRVWSLYRDGFRNMTWGRPLWFLIILKVVILFGVLRLFFFKPVMAGMTEEQKSEKVGGRLSTIPAEGSEEEYSLNEDTINQ